MTVENDKTPDAEKEIVLVLFSLLAFGTGAFVLFLIYGAIERAISGNWSGMMTNLFFLPIVGLIEALIIGICVKGMKERNKTNSGVGED